MSSREDTTTTTSPPPAVTPDTVTNEQLIEELRKFITPDTLDTTTVKSARSQLEKNFSFPGGGLKCRKSDVSTCVESVLKEMKLKTESSSDEEEEEEDSTTTTSKEKTEEEEEKDSSRFESPKKKLKLSDEEEAPRDVAKRQATLMTRADFEEKAGPVLCTVGNSQFYLDERVFAPNGSGQSNVGWGYYKKVKLPIGKHSVWCQVSMNCIVAGSRDWKDGNRKSK